jgi:hypothetical protein
MKKTPIAISVLLFTLIGTSAIYASQEEMWSIEAIVQEILDDQSISSTQEINCETIKESNFEALGDAVMEWKHPGEARDIMDRLMGGEGSESLRLMHRNIGKQYLGCGGLQDIGMMRGGMMGMLRNNYSQINNEPWRYPMMGFGPVMGFGSGMMGQFGVLWVLTWASFIAFLLAGTYFFIKQANKK